MLDTVASRGKARSLGRDHDADGSMAEAVDERSDSFRGMPRGRTAHRVEVALLGMTCFAAGGRQK